MVVMVVMDNFTQKISNYATPLYYYVSDKGKVHPCKGAEALYRPYRP